jgi:hypothetical protein
MSKVFAVPSKLDVEKRKGEWLANRDFVMLLSWISS